ncbi:MAG TPA: PsiF family protein [Casimicrobiaceae bacterium]
MKTFHALALAGLIAVAAPGAYADDNATPPRAAKTASAATPTKISQQDKMRQCAKQATGKKGAERKAFMKTCLSKKA